MEKKEVSVNKMVRAIITGFASYGIIFYVLTLLILVLANRMTNLLENISNSNVKVFVFVFFGIALFFLIRFICRVSTMDAFKKCVVDKENYDRINKKLSIFFIVCIILSLFAGLMLVYLDLKVQRNSINYYLNAYLPQSFSKEQIDESISIKAWNDYNIKRNAEVGSMIAVELGIAFGFLSLINYQGKMLDRYNTFNSKNMEIESNTNVEG